MNAENLDGRLSLLLKLRHRAEDTCRLALEQARSQADAAETQVRRLRHLLEVHNAQARWAMQNDPAAMACYRQSARELTAALADASRFLAEARVELERKRAELEEAMRQRKAADALRRRSAMARTSAEYRTETRAADDLHAARLSAGLGQDSAAEAAARP